MSMTTLRRGAIAIALAVLAPITAVATTTAAPAGAALPACTKTWTNTAGGAWDTAGSWSGSTVPTSTDHVCITTPGTYTVSLADQTGTGPITVASLRVGNPEPGADAQTLVVSRGVAVDSRSLTATEGIEIRPRGTLALGESASAAVSIAVGAGATIANAGTLRQVEGSNESQTIHGAVVNTGTLRLDQSLRITDDLTTEGTLQVDHVLHVEGTMWTKAGTVRGDWVVAAYGGLRVGDADTDRANGAPTFTVEGGALTLEGDSPIDLTVRNEVSVTGDSHPGQHIVVQALTEQDARLTFTGTWTNRGRLVLEPGIDSDASVAGTTLVNHGVIVRFENDHAGTDIDADLINRSLIEIGSGVLTVQGDFENEGSLDLGPGALSVADGILLDVGSVVSLDVGDAAQPGSRLATLAPAIVDGIVITRTEVAQAPGSATTLVTGSSVTGTFDDVLHWGAASYDTEYSSAQVLLRRRASESTTRRFVRAAFQDFLGRQPTTTELAQRATAIDGGTLTRATLVRQLSLSTEYVTTLVQRFYADTLGRPGDPDGVAFWVDQLRTGRKTVAEVAGSFYASSEYFTRAGGTNAAWIDDLYGVFFERNPTSGDLTYWTGRIASRGRTRVAIELFQSLESRRERVDRLYQDLLGRPSDPAGRDFWAARITTAGDLALAVNLASSAEYLERAHTRYP